MYIENLAVLFFPYKSDPTGQSVSSEQLRPAYHLILEDGHRQKKEEQNGYTNIQN